MYFSIIIIHMKLSFRHPTALSLCVAIAFLGSWMSSEYACCLHKLYRVRSIIRNRECHERTTRESRKLPQNSYIYYTDKHHIGHMPENCVQPLLISFYFMLLYCCAQHYNIPYHSCARSPSHTHWVYNVHASRLCSNVHTTTITGWNVCTPWAYSIFIRWRS